MFLTRTIRPFACILLLLVLYTPTYGQNVVVTSEMKGIYNDMDKAYRAKQLRKADSLATAYLRIADALHADLGYNCSQCRFVKAKYLTERGQCTAALAMLDTVVTLRSTYFDGIGPSHLGVVYSEKARVYKLMNQVEQAIVQEQKAAELFLQAKSKENYATSQINLGNYYRQRGEIGDTERSYQCFLKATENAKKGTPEYVISQNAVVRELYAQGQIEKADKMRLKLQKAAVKIYGEQDIRYLQFLTNIAQSLYQVSRFSDAIQAAENAASRYKELGRTKNEDYGKLLNILASCYYKLQDTKKAITLLEEARLILESTVGKEDGNYHNTINLLTTAYYEIGDMSHADYYSGQSQSMLDSGDQNSTKRSFALQNLTQAETCANLGDYPKAIDYAHRALQVFMQRGDSLDIGKTYNALARYYNRSNQKPQCDSIARQAFQLAVRNKFHSIQAEALHLLASNSKPEIAKDFYQQSLALMETNGMKLTAEYAKVLNDMGNCLYQMDNVQDAIQMAREAINIHQSVMGPQHADNVILYFNLAIYHHHLGQQDSVAYYYHKALDLQTQVVRNNFSYLSSSEREKNWNKNNYVFRISPLFINIDDSINPQLLTDIYNSQLFTRGILLSSEIDFRKLLNATSPEVLSEFDKMMSLREQLQKHYSSNDVKAQQSIPQLRKEIETMEHRIVRKCKEYGDFTQNLSLTVDSIEAHLQPSEVAVEIIDAPIRFRDQDDHLYMALILRKGDKHPVVRKLFRQKQLEELGYNGSIPQLLSGSFGNAEKWQNSIYSDERLGKLVWQAIFDAVPPQSHIYFSPTSIFYQWGIEYLPYDGQQRACDVHPITRLSSTKLLAQHRSSPASYEQTRAVIFGGMDYGMSVDDMQSFLSDEEVAETNVQYLALAQAQEIEQVTRTVEASLRDANSITNLQGAEEEAQAIYDMFTEHNVAAKLYTYSGLEERFKQLSGQHINLLHVATHGFSMHPLTSQRATTILGISQMQDADNSLCYSGLFFSGCNNVLSTPPVRLPEGMENGVLTSQEIAELNLQGLELAVLSACQTGLGEVSEDGVIGLQRGFKKAGAQTLVISLWSVDDAATQLMMTTFYRAMMGGDSRQAAFRKAQDAVRKQYPHPHYWAPFIFLDNL